MVRMLKNRFALGLMALAVAAVSASMATFDFNDFLYRASILSYPEHAAFDGTVYPVKRVPNWVTAGDKFNSGYLAFSDADLVDMPYYDPEVLKKPAADLRWGNPADDAVRIAKITYSVPYLGKYTFDGIEGAGSHPAVDIKVPKGTPVYSIANGTVIKASSQSSGFGHHVVVMHNNFPSLNDPSAREVLYSSYSHLGDLLVNVGDVVTKGQQIALSGMTGTATTPHVHFQIDNSEAPWHPFWPFTWSEASDAGLDFFSAVNAGLGKEKALTTTINPLKYIQKYFDSVASAAPASQPVAVVTPAPGPAAVSYVDDHVVVADPVVVEDNAVSDADAVVNDATAADEVAADDPSVEEAVVAEPEEFGFKFDMEKSYRLGENLSFGLDANGTVEGGFTITSQNGKLRPSERTFTNLNEAREASYYAAELGQDLLRLRFDNKFYYSPEFEVVDPRHFSDVGESASYYDAVISLAEDGVIGGYPDGTFRPEATVNRVEALKFILESIDAELDLGEVPFSDVSVREWYAEYLYTGYNKSIVNGDPDGTFRPSGPVNRAEFFKILFNGMNVDINPKVNEAPYEDVPVDSWFAPYIAYAKGLGIIDPKAVKIRPEAAMSRAEVAVAMYKLMELL